MTSQTTLFYNVYVCRAFKYFCKMSQVIYLKLFCVFFRQYETT